MTDEPQNPPESSATSPSDSDETRRATPDTSAAPDATKDKAPGSPHAADEKAGTLPPPPDAE
ncbi:MAG TPA: hypothetical protein VF508_13615, partial [Pyrinomonadaceae bacterium]